MAAAHSENAPLDQQILADHQELRDLHAHFKKSGDIKFFNQFVWELSRHSIGEEIIVYPILEKLGANTIDQLKAEHKEVAALGQELAKLTHPSVEFDAALDNLFRHLTDHMQKEESSDIVLLKTRMPLEERITEGNRFMSRKMIVPTHPHTLTPSNPTMLEVMGLLLAPIDKFRDMFSKFPTEEQLASIQGTSGTSKQACAHGASCDLKACNKVDVPYSGSSSSAVPLGTSKEACAHGASCNLQACNKDSSRVAPPSF